MLKNISPKDADSSYDFVSLMADRCDIKDGSNLSSVLVAIHNERLRPEQQEALYKKLFKNEYSKYDMYRDGGSLEFKLKNGEKVFINKRLGDRGHYCWVVISHKDRTKEVYNDEGEKQPSNSLNDLCEKYNL